MPESETGAAEPRAARLEAEVERLRAELGRAKAEQAALQGRLRDRFDEIAILTRLFADSEDKVAEVQQAAQREIGRSIGALLNAGGARLLPARLRTRMQVGALKRSGLLDPEWYLTRHPDVKAVGADPYWHYVAFGHREGREPNAVLAKAAGDPG